MKNIFDNVDTSYKPGEDFYLFATGNWLVNNPQPKEYPTWDVFTQLDSDNTHRVFDIITKKIDDSIISKKIHDFYEIIMDWDRRNKEGIMSAISFISKHAYYPNGNENIISVTNSDYIIDSAKNNIELFFSTYLSPDSKGSGKYEVNIYQGGLGLGNRDYYMADSEENRKVVSAYKEYLTNMFEKYTGKLSSKYFDAIWNVEKKLAEVSYTEEQLMDPILNYNKISVDELSAETDFDWRTYLCNLGYTETDTVIVNNLEFLKVACKLFKTLSTEILKFIYAWNIMNIASNKLSDDIYDIVFKFYKVFSGATVQIPKWKRAVNKVNSIFASSIGEIYVRYYFDEKSKIKVNNIVHYLKNAFAEIINEQQWMSQKTKDKALDKLVSMKLKIGYPDKFIDYSDIPVSKELSYFDNYMNIRKYLFEKDKQLHYNKDIDPGEWYMAPQTINAYYDCIQNEICFPAGILQYPFFANDRSFAENVGAIGTIIAHEITHAFDNRGRLYDKNGVLTNWWTDKESEEFNKLTDNTKARFDKIEVLPGLHCNGALTLSENIADYGGLKIAYRACQNYYSQKDVNGIVKNVNWKHAFFLSFANNWAGITTNENIRAMVINNEHSVNRVRVNGTLSMFDMWYETYDVKETDPLYVNKEDRAKIW